MDRRQLIVQRAREVFGERLEDVVHMVRQDRQDLRGWEEPSHLRAVLRRAIREWVWPEPTPAPAESAARPTTISGTGLVGKCLLA